MLCNERERERDCAPVGGLETEAYTTSLELCCINFVVKKVLGIDEHGVGSEFFGRGYRGAGVMGEETDHGSSCKGCADDGVYAASDCCDVGCVEGK